MKTTEKTFNDMLALERAINGLKATFETEFQVSQLNEKQWKLWYSASHQLDALTDAKCSIGEVLSLLEELANE